MDTSGLYFPESEKISVNLESFIEKSKCLNFKSFTDKVIYINLNKRTDYKQKIERELSIFPFNIVQRFSAISNANTAVGCTMSHILVLEMAIREGWKNYLVVEDDMIWKNFDFSCISKLTDSSYDVILLGGNNVNYNKDTNKLINGQSKTAYIVNQSYYNKLLRNFKEGVFNLQITGDSKLYAIDKYWTSLQKRDNWYFVDLCYTGETYNDVENQLVKHNNTNAGSILNILGSKR
jgi:GR25 family glycosyltransferase involved in LPS biosynthesis